MKFSEIGFDNKLRKKAKKRSDKDRLREEISADVERFLASGGRVNLLPGTPELAFERRANPAFTCASVRKSLKQV